MRHPAFAQSRFSPMTPKEALRFEPLVSAALAEDGARADITSASTIASAEPARAELVLRSHGVIAGLAVAELVFQTLDARTRFELLVQDGSVVDKAPIARVQGAAVALLEAERVALNFLGLMSGIATCTRAFVDAVSDMPVRICDTRKTAPGLRALERYAVRAGGGFNHRFNLSDAVLIKDNHLAAAGSVQHAVSAARAAVASHTIVEVECESLDQVAQAVEAGADAVLLDNMSIPQMRKAVATARGKAAIEASGGITLENVRQVAATGVDVISVGAITHSAPSADVALDFIGARAPLSR